MNLLFNKKQRMLLKQTDANPYEVGHVLGNPQQKLVDISAKSPVAPSWNTLGAKPNWLM